MSVARHRQDVHEALRFVRTQPSIDPDRVALWGTSLGGGHVLAVAGDEPRVAAVVAQCPGIDMASKRARGSIEIPGRVIVKLLAAAVWDAFRGRLGLSPYYVNIFGRPGETAVFTDPRLWPRYEALSKGSPTWRNEFTPRFYLALPRYREGSAEKLAMPLLLCVADRDIYANPEFQAWVGHRAPRGEVKHYDAEHFDFYHDAFEPVVNDQIEFLKRTLAR